MDKVHTQTNCLDVAPGIKHSPLECVVLSQLLFSPAPENDVETNAIEPAEVERVLAIAQSHHVVMRTLPVYVQMEARKAVAALVSEAINQEQERIENAITTLASICDFLRENQCDVTVIKSLDHWPDMGSDLDLYTNSAPSKVIHLMKKRFRAKLAKRSWGDRLANKWNFSIPGLPELVEIHMGRLGQTGEQLEFAQGIPGRAKQVQISGQTFMVASREDRLLICTMQRMYRHFYARLCDIADTLELLEGATSGLDYEKLQRTATRAGIWQGTATFLLIVSNYVRAYRGFGTEIPRWVRSAAKFDTNQVSFRDGFLRISIAPHSMKLYASQLASTLFQGGISSTVRLSLLPWLAVAAAASHKLTGNDKGIW